MKISGIFVSPDEYFATELQQVQQELHEKVTVAQLKGNLTVAKCTIDDWLALRLKQGKYFVWLYIDTGKEVTQSVKIKTSSSLAALDVKRFAVALAHKFGGHYKEEQRRQNA